MRLLWALLLVLAASANALAQQDYPTRNVIFVVPTGAGAATDLLARILAPQLGDRLGKPFVVEDRPGAGTLTASNAVAKATPDGYTILMGTSTPLAINATLYKHLPYDPVKDFIPLALIATIPFVLVVNNDLPVRSVGVMGDGRRCDFVIALRAVETIDFMTAHWARLPYDFLDEVSRRIVNEVPGISRVVYDISGKPPATIEWE